jgi:hypothetical protein
LSFTLDFSPFCHPTPHRHNSYGNPFLFNNLFSQLLRYDLCLFSGLRSIKGIIEAIAQESNGNYKKGAIFGSGSYHCQCGRNREADRDPVGVGMGRGYRQTLCHREKPCMLQRFDSIGVFNGRANTQGAYNRPGPGLYTGVDDTKRLGMYSPGSGNACGLSTDMAKHWK